MKPQSLDLNELASLSLEDVRIWLNRRLHGQIDHLRPLDPRLGELPHELLADVCLEPNLAPEVRRHFAQAVIEVLEKLSAPSRSDWTAPDAILELLYLLPTAINHTGREDEASELLQHAIPQLPWKTDQGQWLRLQALRALNELNWVAIPRHLSKSFWVSIWNPKNEPKSISAATAILEGVIRHAGLEEGMTWLGGVRPWLGQPLCAALKALLPWMIQRFSKELVEESIATYTFPTLPDEMAKQAMRAVTSHQGLVIWQSFTIERWMYALVVSSIPGRFKVDTKPDGKPVLQCEGTNARILYFLLDELYKYPLKPKEQAELVGRSEILSAPSLNTRKQAIKRLQITANVLRGSLPASEDVSRFSANSNALLAVLQRQDLLAA